MRLLLLFLPACTPFADLATLPEPLPPAFEAQGREDSARLDGVFGAIDLAGAQVDAFVWVGGRYVDFELQATDGADWVMFTGSAELGELEPGTSHPLDPADVVAVSDGERVEEPEAATITLVEQGGDLWFTLELGFADGTVVGEVLVDPV